MASYNLEIKPSAKRELCNLPKPVAARLTTLIQGLKENPYPPGTRKMAGMQDAWRIRAGDYRIVYRILGNILTIEVIRIGHRGDEFGSLSGVLDHHHGDARDRHEVRQGAADGLRLHA